MTPKDDEQLTARVRELLAPERNRKTSDLEAKAAVKRQLLATLAAPDPTASTNAPKAIAPQLASSKGILGTSIAKPVSLLVAFGLGTSAGALLHSVFATP